MNLQNNHINELFRIINGALRLDIDKVRNYTSFLADKLEKEGNESAASKLRKMLLENDGQLKPTDVSFSKMLPVDSESRFPLVEKVNLKEINDFPLFLPEYQWDLLNEFLSVAKSYGQITAQDVSGSLSLLMYGLPGTGKTRLARHIANELGLELYIARLDGLISSFLGSTSKNIRALFDFASKTPCVLFLDEFDAIAKVRGDAQELGELKRVVNSFLQNLDTLGKQSIVIAATNHETLLDSAVWRRFSYRLELTLPSQELRQEMWNVFLSPLSFPTKDITLLVDLSDGYSGSDIYEVCLRLRRKKIISQKNPELKDAFSILRNIAVGDVEKQRFISGLKDLDEINMAKFLRDRDPKLYSMTAIASLFGVSKATAHRLTQK